VHFLPASQPEPQPAAATQTPPHDAAWADASRWVAYAAGVGIYVWLLARSAVRREDWEVAILGAGAVLLVTTMANYYIGVLAGFGFLWLRDEEIGAALCALAAFTWCAQWIGPSIDEIYTWISLACVLFVLTATARAAFAPGEQESALP
jgi:hypothetical protein